MLKQLGIPLPTTLMKFANSLRLDQQEEELYHIPGFAMFKAFLQLALMYSGRDQIGVLSLQDLVKLLVISYTRQLL